MACPPMPPAHALGQACRYTGYTVGHASLPTHSISPTHCPMPMLHLESLHAQVFFLPDRQRREQVSSHLPTCPPPSSSFSEKLEAQKQSSRIAWHMLGVGSHERSFMSSRRHTHEGFFFFSRVEPEHIERDRQKPVCLPITGGRSAEGRPSPASSISTRTPGLPRPTTPLFSSSAQVSRLASMGKSTCYHKVTYTHRHRSSLSSSQKEGRKENIEVRIQAQEHCTTTHTQAGGIHTYSSRDPAFRDGQRSVL